MNQDIQGGCMCGAVRYSATANPANSMVCHCQSCRRSAASPVVAWVTFAKAEFRFTRGTPREYESSAKVKRRFCGACGSPLTYEHLDTPRLLRCDHLQPGCAVGISAHASFLAQRRHRLGEIRRWAADVRAVAIWRSFLSSRPRGSRCGACEFDDAPFLVRSAQRAVVHREHRRSRRAHYRRRASLSARGADGDVREIRLRPVARRAQFGWRGGRNVRAAQARQPAGRRPGLCIPAGVLGTGVCPRGGRGHDAPRRSESSASSACIGVVSAGQRRARSACSRS